MDLEQKYKEETGFDVGKIHEIGTTYYSDDYVKWLEKEYKKGFEDGQEPIECRNCGDMVIMVSEGEFCPHCYC